MRKIICEILVLAFFFNSNLYAEKKSQLGGYSVYSVDEWIVQVKNYYNQSSGTKISKSSISLNDAENKALNECREDKIFSLNKPEGCLIYSKKETYEHSWRYFMGAKPPEPIERIQWLDSVINYERRIEEKNKEQERIIDANNKEQQRVVYLEKEFGKKCNKYSKASNQYNSCLLEQEKIAKNIEEKKLFTQQERQRKLLETEKTQKKIIEDKQKEETIKIAKMTPDDRRAYICSEKYGFRKGSDNFKDCIFKIYTAEIELEKLELQKQLAKANADLAKANAASNERLANAQTNAAIMQAYAAQQQAIAANTADSLALMESGLRMMSPQRSTSRAPMNCQYHAKMLSCF